MADLLDCTSSTRFCSSILRASWSFKAPSSRYSPAPAGRSPSCPEALCLIFCTTSLLLSAICSSFLTSSSPSAAAFLWTVSARSSAAVLDCPFALAQSLCPVSLAEARADLPRSTAPLSLVPMVRGSRNLPALMKFCFMVSVALTVSGFTPSFPMPVSMAFCIRKSTTTGLAPAQNIPQALFLLSSMASFSA